jgi:hypothetical protein
MILSSFFMLKNHWFGWWMPGGFKSDRNGFAKAREGAAGQLLRSLGAPVLVPEGDCTGRACYRNTGQPTSIPVA